MSKVSNATAEYVFDVRTSSTGCMADWIKRFDFAWEKPQERMDALLGLLHPDVVLRQPGRPEKVVGHEMARGYFSRALRAAPDLTAKTQGWCGNGDFLFLDILFSATLGNKPRVWNGIDRFRFYDGIAIERKAFFEDSTVVINSCLRHPKGWKQLAILGGIL